MLSTPGCCWWESWQLTVLLKASKFSGVHERLIQKTTFLSVPKKLLQCLSGFPAWLISKHDITHFCSSWPFQGKQVAGRPLSTFPSHFSICTPELLAAKQMFFMEDLISWGFACVSSDCKNSSQWRASRTLYLMSHLG